MSVSLKKQAAYYIIKVRNATDLHLFQFRRIFSREWRWLDCNCISSGHELFENKKLFIYYSFFCLFVCLLLKRLVLSFSLVSMKFFFYDIVCLTFQKRGLNHFPANFIFELSEVWNINRLQFFQKDYKTFRVSFDITQFLLCSSTNDNFTELR